MSIHQQINRIITNIGNAYDELEAKGAAMPTQKNSANLTQTISMIPEPAVSHIEPNGAAVVLVDWDGLLLKTYTYEEIMEAESLPAAPERDNSELTFQNWNWTFGDIKSYLTQHPNDTLYVGSIYRSADGTDHSDYFTEAADARMIYRASTSITASMFQTFYFLRCINIPHGTTTLGFQQAFYNCYSLENVNIPSTVSEVKSGTFRGCSSLRTVSLPKEISVIESNAFRACSTLERITLPDTVRSIGEYAFFNCYALNKTNIPEGVDTVSSSSYQNTALEYIKLPSTIGTVANNAFNGCKRLKVLDLSSLSQVPNLSNTNALAGTASTMKIYVKNAEMLAAFSAAANWSDFASQMEVKA